VFLDLENKQDIMVDFLGVVLSIKPIERSLRLDSIGLSWVGRLDEGGIFGH